MDAKQLSRLLNEIWYLNRLHHDYPVVGEYVRNQQVGKICALAEEVLISSPELDWRKPKEAPCDPQS